ncbi:hypothetical protein GLAREA_06230 [Glarea lozoyensis ATCC 20868]|uniref:Uncharacterized protein n=1 Tax=Glarea lozoyensis (strain ATCC 20868 / MF5171) TaxID=1116229 RepID=S3E459_GLAL2|nr:uncharacterized protein GLAREA_06230 [Glarea lozoyensis ATCC 20868]EPE33218.1 hypothetical protein GLAREA_06230 [Glarea lozoyensis ATCC 20868]
MSSASFLDMPENIRLRIYTYAGLIRLCPIELNVPEGYCFRDYDSSWGTDRSTEERCLYVIRLRGGDRSIVPLPRHLAQAHSEPDCLCPRLPIQLLYVSRRSYEDVFPVFYSRNKFIMRYKSADDLPIFLNLNHHILSTVKDLLVRFNSWPCARGHPHIVGRQVGRFRCSNCLSMPPSPDYALEMATSAGTGLLVAWKTISTHLASSIRPKQLNFAFICDVAALNSGKAVVEPLLMLPTLNRCTIRLNNRPNYALNSLARDVSVATTQSLVLPSRPFPFDRLPRELRLHVLGYTHLGRHNGYLKRDELIRIQDGKLVRGSRSTVHKGNQCCRQCTHIAIDCCCPSSFAAYSITCVCRRLPSALVYVNREMRQDALTVLLRENCFDCEQDPDKSIEFLSQFPAGRLKYIREIQFRFSESGVKHWGNQNYSEQWLSLVKFIKARLNVPALSITVVTDTFDLGMDPHSSDEGVQRHIYNIYCDITRSLCVLDGIGHIKFELGCFGQLESLMSRKVVGKDREELYPEADLSIMSRRYVGFEAPHWFKEEDFTGDSQLEFGSFQRVRAD